MRLRVGPAIAIGTALGVTIAVPLAASAGARARGDADPAHAQGLQWGLDQIDAPAAWAHASGTGVTIAIVDSGADLDHEDLDAKIVGSVSCIGADGDPDRCHGDGADDDGHGTHVAGIAAATTTNGIGIAGVAPGASLLIVRVLEHDCGLIGDCTASGEAADVTAGIRWAAAHGADVINLSLGSTSQAVLGPAFADAVTEAWDAGAIPVVASGNSFVLSSGFADEPAVVVTATTRDDTEAAYANGVGRAQWGVAAPGGAEGDSASTCSTDGAPLGILSTYWDRDDHDQYACLAGTSMAAPHVSGALAVLRSAGLSPEQAVDRLLRTAADLGADGRDSTYGWGRIDLAAATDGLPTTSTTTPSSQPTTTATSPPTSAGGTTPSSNGASSSSTTSSTSGGTATTGDSPSLASPAPDRDGGRPDKPAGVVAVAISLAAATGAASVAALLRRRQNA